MEWIINYKTTPSPAFEGSNFSKKKLLKGFIALLIVFILLLQGKALAIEEQGERDKVNFTILHTNDEHSALIPHTPAIEPGVKTTDESPPSFGAFARLSKVVDEIREEKKEKNESVFLLNAGDFLGGSPFSWLVLEGYAAEIELMQEIGYDAALLGNHEFDYGAQKLAEYLREAGYPQASKNTTILSKNIEVPQEHPLKKEELYEPFIIKEIGDDVKLGVFGLLGEDAYLTIKRNENISLIQPIEAAEEAVDKLNEEGVDVIAALTHAGVEEDKELASKVEGIDIIVGGHSHDALFEPIKKEDTLIVQAGEMLRYLGKLELSYDKTTGEVTPRKEENKSSFLLPINSTLAYCPEVYSKVKKYKEIINDVVAEKTKGDYESILQPVATSSFEIPDYPLGKETPAGNYVTDAMRLMSGEIKEERVDVALQAGGSVRKGIVPKTNESSDGEISFYDMAEVASLGSGEDGRGGYPIVSFYLTGRELKTGLEVAVLMDRFMGDDYFLHFSGVEYKYDIDDSVVFTIPVLDIPIPSMSAVKEARVYKGEGVQPPLGEEGEFESVKGDKLYHVVTDSYLLSFLPMAGEMLPFFDVGPKDKEGEVFSPDETGEMKLDYKGRELKTWDTLVKYASTHPKEEEGLPVIPDYYSEVRKRGEKLDTFSIGWGALLGIVTLLLVFFYLFKGRIKRSSKKSTKR